MTDLLATGSLGVYGAALRRAAAGERPLLEVVGVDGDPLGQMQPAQWTGGLRPGDRGLLDRCEGPTLDVGCGPGRLTAALAEAGRTVLGVDISAEAVRQARQRGAPALCRSVFDPLPREGSWQHVLLADGSIGIGGDPARLLRRCGRLLAPRGDVLVEVLPPGARTWSAQVVLRDRDKESVAFPWACVAAPDLAELAQEAALRVLDLWTDAGRWFASVARGRPRR